MEVRMALLALAGLMKSSAAAAAQQMNPDQGVDIFAFLSVPEVVSC